MNHLLRIQFRNFKAFKAYSLSVKQFNILVGPNNAGKSTIIAALRILAAALRKAHSRKSELVKGPLGVCGGYSVDLRDIAVADENIFHNYDESIPASVEFSFPKAKSLLLFFPNLYECYLIPDAAGKNHFTPSTFKTAFEFDVGFVPILGPVEPHEKLYEKEAARSALYNYGAARNFRNIWYHYPDKFEVFKNLLSQTWPGMDIERPQLEPDYKSGKHTLTMFCPEERIPREIFWAGYGFQVWCQLLTHLVLSQSKSLFVIDEPDIYLHPELQRQLINALRTLGPDILIATHSTEIISEAEPDEIVLIDKKRSSARRIKDPAQLTSVFKALGSNLNPLLTQLAKTRRALFVEGNDFQVLSKFALKLGYAQVSAKRGFAVVPIDGFNLDRIRSIRKGIEATLGTSIGTAAILDRDYRSKAEVQSIVRSFSDDVFFLHIHSVKEVENFLLVPAAIDRAAKARLHENIKRGGKQTEIEEIAGTILSQYAAAQKSYVFGQHMLARTEFAKRHKSSESSSVFMAEVHAEFESDWDNGAGAFRLIGGKDCISDLNLKFQQKFGVSVSPHLIVEHMNLSDIQEELKTLLKQIDEFSKSAISD